MFVHHFILRKSCCHISTSANCQFISFLQTHIYYSYVFCLLLISLYIEILSMRMQKAYLFLKCITSEACPMQRYIFFRKSHTH